MSDGGGTIRARLGLDKTDWKQNATGAAEDVKRINSAVVEGRAAVSAYERALRAAGSGTAEQVKQLKEAQSELKGLERNLKQAEKAVRDFDEAAARAAPAKVARPTSFVRSRAEIIREARAQEEKDLRSADPGPSSRGGRDEDDEGPHGGGSNRMRNQELAHSGRALIDMVMAGQSPLRALQFEAPRVIQALGGGLASILGIGAAVAGITALIEKTVELGQAAQELHRNFDAALNGDTTQGQQSVSALQKRIEQLDAVLAQAPPPSGALSRAGQRVGDVLSTVYEATSSGANSVFGGGPVSIHAPGAQREEDVAANEAKRTETLGKLVAAETQLNDLKAEEFSQGKDIARQDEIQLELKNKISDIEASYGIPALREARSHARSPEEIARTQRALDDKTNAASGSIEQARRASGLENTQATISAADYQRGLEDRMTRVTAVHPDLLDANGDVRNIIASGEGRAFEDADRQAAAAQAHFENVRSSGGDTREARVALAEKTAAMLEAARASNQEHDSAQATTREMEQQAAGHKEAAELTRTRAQYEREIASAIHDGKNDLAEQLRTQQQLSVAEINLREFLKTPAQRAQEARNATRHAQDLKRSAGGKPHTLDADKGESLIHDADSDGSVIPDASAGTGAYNSPLNTHSPTFDELSQSSIPAPDVSATYAGPDNSEIIGALTSGFQSVVDACSYKEV